MTRQSSIFIIIMSLLLVIVLTGVLSTDQFRQSEESGNYQFRALPRPIAKEPILITSAGQNTDSYIVKDIANQLMMDNYFAPKATDASLEGMSSVVMVIGYSDASLRLKDMTYQEELARVEVLLEQIKARDLSLVTVYLRGNEMLNHAHRELLEVSAANSEYLIIVDDGDSHRYFSELAQTQSIAITIVSDITEVSEPFVSAFR